MCNDDYEPVLTAFLGAMDRGDFDVALELAAADATYVRPTLNKPGEPLGSGSVSYHGKPEIARFMRERGRRDMRQRVLVSASAGRHLFAEGLIEFGDGSPDLRPLFHLAFGEDGRILRFRAVR